MNSLNYEYVIDDEISEYEFEDLNSPNSVILLKPTPSVLNYSTRTVNLSIFPICDYEKRIDYINNVILPPLFEKYKINIKFHNDILKKIILYRIIKDSIPYDTYFNSLCSYLVSEPLTMDLVMHKIENTQSKFIDIKFIVDFCLLFVLLVAFFEPVRGEELGVVDAAAELPGADPQPLYEIGRQRAHRRVRVVLVDGVHAAEARVGVSSAGGYGVRQQLLCQHGRRVVHVLQAVHKGRVLVQRAQLGHGRLLLALLEPPLLLLLARGGLRGLRGLGLGGCRRFALVLRHGSV